MTATGTPVRDLAGICEAARRANCGHCWQRPGLACAASPAHGDGFHVSRFGRAWRRGLISDGEYKAVLRSVPLFESGTVIYAENGGQL
jgi:hypothetical protein